MNASKLWPCTLSFVLFLSACSAVSNKPAASATFPAFVYASAGSLETYRIAMEMPEALAAVPCYCGCVEPAEHGSLKECFIKPDGELDQHAAGCDLCGKEAVDVAEWRRAGQSLPEIRNRIDQKYQEYGRPTDTPRPDA